MYHSDQTIPVIGSWSFIRYSDGHDYIRRPEFLVKIHNTQTYLNKKVFNQIVVGAYLYLNNIDKQSAKLDQESAL